MCHNKLTPVGCMCRGGGGVIRIVAACNDKVTNGPTLCSVHIAGKLVGVVGFSTGSNGYGVKH